MTYDEAKTVSEMTLVMWDDNPDETGVVTDIGYSGFEICCTVDGATVWINFRDAEKVSLYKPAGS